MKFGLLDTVVEKIQNIFAENARVDKAIVFGSRAKGNYKEGSDIDISIKGQELNFDDTLSLLRKLDELELPYEIDLINYHTIKEPDLKDHIDRVGIELYSRWKEIQLRSISSDISYGYTASADSENVGSKFLRITDITSGNVNWETVPFCKISEKDNLKYKLGIGDIVIARTGATTGYNTLIKKEVDAVFASYLIRFQIDKKKANPFFVGYVLQSNNFQDYVDAIAGGSAQPGANAQQFADYEFLLPPLIEQTAIATILTSLDDKIDLLNRQNKTLEQLAETLFRQWFVEEAEESWEEKSLTDIADYLNGLALQKFPAKIDYLPVIKIREMKQGISENTDRCSRDIPIQYIIQDGDVLFSWSGSLEVVLWTGGEGALNQHLFKVSSKSYPKWFYYLATKHHLAEFKVIAESKSTTMGHIQREHLNQAMIPIPPQKIFDQYDERIAPMLDKIIDNHKQIRTLTQNRDTLLPKLMSGEVRVSEL